MWLVATGSWSDRQIFEAAAVFEPLFEGPFGELVMGFFFIEIV
jgi:hypothetical protein